MPWLAAHGADSPPVRTGRAARDADGCDHRVETVAGRRTRLAAAGRSRSTRWSGDAVRAPAGGQRLFAHYLLAHNIGTTKAANGPPRQTVYYRLRPAGDAAAGAAVTDPLLELA